MKKSIILISVLAIMSVNSVLGAVKAVPIQGTTFDTNNSQETENSNINLKIINVFVAGDDTKVKAILEDKTNVSQYTKVHLISNAESNIDFYLLKNGEWRHLSNNSSFISSTIDRVEETEYYNKELTFSIPKYIMIPNTLASFPTLSKPINGHFKLKYYDYEVEFDVDNNTLVNNLENNSKDENNSIKNANVSLKILDASMSEYNNIRVKAVLEDKSNPAQYKEFKFTASYGGVNLESFQILENNEWKNLDSYPIDRFGAPTGTQALVDMYCEYNSDLIFYLPKYIAGNPSRELPNPVSGHFKLKYCGYEAEFYIKDNKLSNENNYNNDNNNNYLVNDDLTLLDKKEMDDFTGLKDGYYYLNGVKLVNKWVEIEGKGYYFDSDGKNYKFNP